MSQLKKFLFEEGKENNIWKTYGYYYTIEQHQDKLSNVINDCEKYDFNFHYEEDKTEGYTNGKITVYFYNDCVEDVNYHYEIELLYDERYWGYCECKPEDEGYNEEKQCCGCGCDWIAPRVEINKIESLARFSFDGYARDMWKLEEQWNKEFGQIQEDKKKKLIDEIDQEIERLLQRKAKLESEINT